MYARPIVSRVIGRSVSRKRVPSSRTMEVCANDRVLWEKTEHIEGEKMELRGQNFSSYQLSLERFFVMDATGRLPILPKFTKITISYTIKVRKSVQRARIE